MNKDELQQKIAEYFSKLPQEAQEIFSSMKWIDTVEEVSKKYNLTETQSESLATETSLALLGVIHLNQYEENLVSELGLTKEKADQMIQDIDKNVFVSIRPALVNAFNNNTIDLAQQKYGGDMKIDERFANLPQEVQDAILDSNYKNCLHDIAEKYTLSMGDMNTLDEVTTKVMLGIIPNENYNSELAKSISTTKENIDAISRDVNEKVFKSIRFFLMKQTTKPEMENEVNEVPIPPYKREESLLVSQATPKTDNIPITKMDPVIPRVPENLPIATSMSDVPKFQGDALPAPMAPVPTPIATKKNEMENAGIEILEDVVEKKDEEKKVTAKEDSILENSGIDVYEEKPTLRDDSIPTTMMDKKFILDGIENPTHSEVSNMHEVPAPVAPTPVFTQKIEDIKKEIPIAPRVVMPTAPATPDVTPKVEVTPAVKPVAPMFSNMMTDKLKNTVTTGQKTTVQSIQK